MSRDNEKEVRKNVHIESSDSLAFGVFGVCDRVPDDVLEEDLEDTTSLFIDETGDTLDTTTAGKTTNSGLDVLQ